MKNSILNAAAFFCLFLGGLLAFIHGPGISEQIAEKTSNSFLLIGILVAILDRNNEKKD